MKNKPPYDPWYVAKCEGHESLDPPNVNKVQGTPQEQRSCPHCNDIGVMPLTSTFEVIEGEQPLADLKECPYCNEYEEK